MRRSAGYPVPWLLLVAAAASGPTAAEAGDIGHFNGGVMSLRDYLVPDPGVYAAVYNYFYRTDRLNDAHGDEADSVRIDPPGGGAGVTVQVDLDVDMYALAPSLIWVTKLEALGVRYGALITPTFANLGLDAALSALDERGGSANAGSFGVGDLFVQPVWLGLTLDHWDFAFAYGFYAPIGRYETERVTVPGIGSVKAEAADNIGYGFWTHQLQGSLAWYPMEHKGTALIGAVTYETNGEKQGFDVTPGDVLTFNWGASQFVPLRKDMSLLLEVGPGGYDTWQISDDSGGGAADSRDQVHAVGGQVGLVVVPWAVAVNLRGFGEFASEARFQGWSLGLNLVKKF
jgi:hypothetical protein